MKRVSAVGPASDTVVSGGVTVLTFDSLRHKPQFVALVRTEPETVPLLCRNAIAAT